MFYDIKITKDQTIYIQVYNYLKEIIENGMLPSGSKLLSTREMSSIIGVSRNTVMRAYELLEECNLIYTLDGKGTFVSKVNVNLNNEWNIKWNEKISSYAICADKLDIMKHEKLYEKWKF